MAYKLIAPAGTTGISNPKFVRFRTSDGAVWSTAGTPAFEAYNASNIANYGIAATEMGATGIYTVTDPAEGTFGDWVFVAAAGASLVVSDLVSNVYYTGESDAKDVTATASVDETAVANAVAALLAAQTNVQVTSTVQGNTITINRGSSYNTTTGRTIPITVSGDNWPTDLTGWTITMDVYQTHEVSGEVAASPDSSTGISGTVTQATGSSRAVRIDVTTTITSGLNPGVYDYYVEATSGSDRTTLRQGKLFVKDDNPNG